MLKFKQTEVQRFLGLAIRHFDYLDVDNLKKLYEKLDDKLIFEQAKLNGVDSIVGHSLTKIIRNQEEIPRHWELAYEKIDLRITSYMAELEKAATLLAANDIELLALKNSGITIGMYPYYGACPMGDIDVLVSRKKFRKAHKILSESGYKLKFRSPLEEDNIASAEHGGGAEYSVILENGEHLWFELQWRPVAGRWIQPKSEPKADDLVERSVEIIDSNVRLLSPEDNLLQVALHTAKHSFVRAPGFRLHTDVDRIVSTQTIDWFKFCELVKILKVRTSVYLSLAMAKSLVGTNVPDTVLVELKPSRIKVAILRKWIERVGVYEPDAPKWSKLGYIIFVSLLFDSITDWYKGVFPSSDELKEQYNYSNSFKTPYYLCKRIANLVFRRVST